MIMMTICDIVIRCPQWSSFMMRDVHQKDALNGQQSLAKRVVDAGVAERGGGGVVDALFVAEWQNTELN